MVGLIQECWTVLAGMAALVPRVRLGTLVIGNTYRNPAVLAKQAAHRRPHLRRTAGPGPWRGWQESEHHAYGIPFPTAAGG